MIHFSEVEIGPLIALLAVLFAVSMEFGVKRARLHRRTIQLNTANDLLKEHFAALQRFVEDPSAPSKPKERLLIFSKVISDEKAFVDVVRQVCENPEFKRDSEARGYTRDLQQIRAQDTDLAETFSTAVNAGVSAMLLRYPNAGDLLEATMARIYASPRKEGALFAGAMKKERAERDSHDAVPAPA